MSKLKNPRSLRSSFGCAQYGVCGFKFVFVRVNSWLTLRPGEFGEDGGVVAGALGGANVSVDGAGGASVG